jgi:hypothetical protein
MPQPMFDAEALVGMFEKATAQQGAQVRQAVTDATLAALQGRELTLKNIRAALNAVSEATNQGLSKNADAGIDAPGLLDNAVAGMDAALLKAVEANRVALSQFAAQGVDLQEKHLKKALADIDKFEDALFDAMRKAASSGAGAPLAGAWGPLLEKMQAGGTNVGAKAASLGEDLTNRMQTTMKTSRAAGIRAAQALAESYTAMVSGVLLGMSNALQSQQQPAKTASRKTTSK